MIAAFLVAWLLFVPPSSVRADDPAPVDVAVVTGLSGEARVDGEALTPFQQVEAGALVELGDGGALTLVYFTGRKETWEGPALLEVQSDRGVARGGAGGEAASTEAPEDVPAAIETLPHVIGSARAAVTVVLAPVPFDLPASPDCRNWHPLALTQDERAELAHARDLYERMHSGAGAGDFTADAYWLSVLGRFDRFDEIAVVVADLETRLPGNPALAVLRERASHCAEALAGGEDS